ncbi:MAG: carbohydrate kinase family protein [Firmicutes bacterium]|nr:carbohydrate kinase family protein [Bacillota bacterium]HXL03952.1 carbohydrate kinase family protein [Bacillota bacterium]
MGGPDEAVVCLGACAMDMMFTVDRLPEPDEMVFAEGEAGFFAGGSTANIAAGIGRLGYRSRFVGRTGDDENGRKLRQAFESDGVDVRWLTEIEGGRTAQTIIAVDRTGERVIYSLGGEAILQKPDEFPDEAMVNAKVLYIGEVLPNVALEAIQVARRHCATIIYGPGGGISWMDKATLTGLIKSCDYVVLSRGELAAVTSSASHTEGAGRLLECGVGHVVVTLGSDGSECHFCDSASGYGECHHKVFRAPAFSIPDVIDTTGAGDSFTSGFITGLLEGMDTAECLMRGNACAALAIRKVGAREAMPSGEELKEFLQNAKM